MFKHKYFISLLIGVFLIAPIAVFSAGTAEEEAIREFSTIIKINQDSSLSITEIIVYDFGSNSKHGIFRDIPLSSIQDGKEHKIKIENVSVVDENNKSYNFEQSKIDGGKTRIKIGDSDKLVTGVKIYQISYLAKGVVLFLADRDEIYWNATGNEWAVPIASSFSTIVLPKPMPEADVKFDCYSGKLGVNGKCEFKELQKNEAGLVSAVKFNQSGLLAQSGLTVAVGLPVGTVDKPGFFQRLFDFIQKSWPLLLPIVIFIISYSIWKKRGKDPKGVGTIITQFDAPDKLSPLEVGILADYKADDRELAGELIYLATRGYIKIKQIPEFDYELERIKKNDEGLADFQKILLEKLFGSEDKKIISKLKYRFGKAWREAMNKCDKGLIEKKYFPEDPLRLRNIFYAIGGTLPFVLFMVLALGSVKFNVGAVEIISAVISVAILFIFGHIMPTRTESGQRVKEYIEGLKIYLNVAEKDRLNFHNAPEKKPEHFEMLLPFAIVLGVEKKWAGQFDDIVMSQPDWYAGSRTGAFSASTLVSDLGRFRSVGITNAVSAKPDSGSGGHNSWSSGGSSGGGSSGGGSGGGGGGSW